MSMRMPVHLSTPISIHLDLDEAVGVSAYLVMAYMHLDLDEAVGVPGERKCQDVACLLWHLEPLHPVCGPCGRHTRKPRAGVYK